jgi:hypothetical protein
MWRSIADVLVVVALLASACGAPAPPASSARAAAAAQPAGRTIRGTTFRFASAAEGRALLESADEFTRALSAFDRSLRLKRREAISDAEYRRFAGEQARDFTVEETNAWASAVEEVGRATEGLDIGLPPRVLLVKTTGREELDAAYTRGHAVILPARVVENGDAPRVGSLAHELFHVSSRASASRRDARYALLGFAPVRALAAPADLEPSRLTNPDAHALDHFARVTVDGGGERAVVPLLTCDLPIAEAIRTDAWFKTVRVVLIEIDPATGAPSVDADGRTRALDASRTDWNRRLGQNTEYVIHPEEVLADNFALIVLRRLGREVAAPQRDFLDAFERSLRAPPPRR